MIVKTSIQKYKLIYHKVYDGITNKVNPKYISFRQDKEMKYLPEKNHRHLGSTKSMHCTLFDRET